MQAKNGHKKASRNVGLQTVVMTRTYLSPQILSHHNLEKDEFSKLFYTSHTLTMLFIFVFYLNYLCYYGIKEVKDRTE